MGTANLAKVEREGTPQLLSLTKTVVDMHKGGSKRAAVVVYLDRSNSTNDHDNRWGGNVLWDDGTMELLKDIVAAIALGGFDDNNSAPLRFFHTEVVAPIWPKNGEIELGNAKEILAKNKKVKFHGTAFIPVFLDLVRQALLLEASTRLSGKDLVREQDRIEKMSDRQVTDFIRPRVENGVEVLEPKLKLPYPVYGLVGTDGESGESLELLKQYLRWLSQLGIYIMLVGVGVHEFKVLSALDQAGEDTGMKKQVPLWDNADFLDFKDLTGGAYRVPNDDPALLMEKLLGKFKNNAYPDCRSLGLIG